MRILLVAWLIMAGVSSAWGQTLSPVETAMAKAVDAESAAAAALLEKIVDINSGTMNLPGVVAVKDVIAPQIEGLGFTVVWNPMQAVAGRAGDLVHEHPDRACAT